MTTEPEDTGNTQGIGYKNPPKDTRFGGVRANKRNNNGRPKSFDALRKLAQSIAGEQLTEAEKMTRIEAMLRVMSSSRNPADRKTFLEYAYGKPKDEIDHSGETKVELVVRYDNANNKPTDPA